MILDRAAILSVTALPVEPVEVPEWGGTVHVRTLTGIERDAFEASTVRVRKDGKTEPNMTNLRGRLVALVLCDASGKRLFSDDDAPELGRRSAAALERILKVARRLNGMDETSLEDARGN